MARKWVETLSPKYLHEQLGVYNGTWMPEMDRCWQSDDGYQVTSRILFTSIGKVEHAAITRQNNHKDLADALIQATTNDGSGDIPWAIKQEIKNELFGKDRTAIEVFPMDSHLVDASDVYHLWILPKGYKMPFGIHPIKDTQCKAVNRGVSKDPTNLIKNTMDALGMDSSGVNNQSIGKALQDFRQGKR